MKEPIFKCEMNRMSELELPPSLQENLRLICPHSSDVVRFKSFGSFSSCKSFDQVVFGDGLNDLEFVWLRWSVSQWENLLKLQEKADYITKNLEEDGIF